MVDPEAEVREEDEDDFDDDDDDNDVITETAVKANVEVLPDGTQIVLSHPRRKNHNIKGKKSPPTTPAKAGNESSSCLERRIE